MPKFEDALKIATSRHDLVAIRVSDPRDKELPNVGIIEMRDAESGEKIWVDSSSSAVREYFARHYTDREQAVSTLLKHNRIDTADVTTDADYVAELIKLFKKYFFINEFIKNNFFLVTSAVLNNETNFIPPFPR